MQKNVNTFIHSLSSLENHTRFQSDQKGQNLYSFSDQKGVKTLPVGTAHTYIAYVRKYPTHPTPPPPPPNPRRQIIHTICPLGCKQPYTLLRLITTLSSRMSSNFAFQSGKSSLSFSSHEKKSFCKCLFKPICQYQLPAALTLILKLSNIARSKLDSKFS